MNRAATYKRRKIMKTSNKNASVKVKLEYTEESHIPFFRVYQVHGYSKEQDRTETVETFLNREDAEAYIKRNSDVYTHLCGMWVYTELVWLY